MEGIGRRLKEENVHFRMLKRMGSHGILGCLRRIDEADVVYIVNPGGYVGRSVSVDIGYAYAKNKLMYAMFPVDDPPVMDLVDGVMSLEALMEFLKEGHAARM